MGTSRTETAESAPPTHVVNIEGSYVTFDAIESREHVAMPINLALSAPLLLDVCKKLLIATDGMYNEADWQQIKDEVIAMNEAVKFATR